MGKFGTLTNGSTSAILAITMGLYIAKTFQRRADGSRVYYYILRENYWDAKQKRQRTRYMAYLGRKPVLPLDKARTLAKKIGVSLDDLRKVRRLKILDEKTRSSTWRS